MPEREILNPRNWKTHPPYLHEPYRSSLLRAPKRPLVALEQSLSELSGPVFGDGAIGELDNDLTKNAAKNGEVIGERIIVAGWVLDESSHPVRNALIEIWQANANGRYIHKVDQHDAAIDPNFFGAGRTLTDDDGRYRFTTIRPGAYPWGNHHNAWRPAHIHFSLFGTAFIQRLVTQMYFPGDPLLPHDPIYNCTPDPRARERLISKFSLDITEPDWALGYEFNIVLRGPKSTPMESD